MNEDDHKLDLQDAPIPEPLIPDFGLWPWWLAAGVVLLAAIFAWWYGRRPKRRAMDPGQVRGQAFQEAEKALAEVQTNDPRDAAVQASLIVRKYLSLAARDPALFETHEEFIARRDSLSAMNAHARTAAAEGFARLAAFKYAPDLPVADAASVLTESRLLLASLHHGFAE